jgi:hypothetical protein
VLLFLKGLSVKTRTGSVVGRGGGDRQAAELDPEDWILLQVSLFHPLIME